MTTEIDTADTVRHIPTGEKWLVAYVEGNYLSWCGWPEGEAKLSDCVLIKSATDEQRQNLLKNMASMQGDDSRKRYAIKRLQDVDPTKHRN